MGKCLRCKKVDAAYVDTRGKRAHCDDCKDPHATRHVRKKRKVPGVDYTKVDTNRLPSRPCIVPIDLIEFAPQTLIAVAGARALLRDPTQVELDVSTNSDLQAAAIQMGELCVHDYTDMADMCFDVAVKMQVNRTAVLGINVASAKTDRHEHAPLGVLHVATDRKLWRFWCPGSKSNANPDRVVTVNGGEMLWFPPGWGHEVITLRGEIYDDTDLPTCISWVSWCLPRHLTRQALQDLFDGTTTEAQRPRRPSKKVQCELSELGDAWAAG